MSVLDSCLDISKNYRTTGSVIQISVFHLNINKIYEISYLNEMHTLKKIICISYRTQLE